MKTHLVTLIILLILSSSIGSLAQKPTASTDSTTYQIFTKDGNIYTGTIVERHSEKIVLATSTIGVITIPYDQIKEMREIVGSIADSQNWRYNPQTVTYFTSASAYSLKRGEGLYSNTWIFFNNFSYGLTDNFTIGGGLLATFFFNTTTPAWLTGRWTQPIIENKWNVGIGGVYGTVEEETFGYLYGVSTFGSRDRNITLGAGSGVANGEFSDLLLTFAGTYRTGAKFYFLFDSYIVEESLFAFLGGRSIVGRASLEYGLLTSSEFSIAGIPILGITLPLHKE